MDYYPETDMTNVSRSVEHLDNDAAKTGSTQSEETLSIPPHHLGIRPLGNSYLSTRNLKSCAGFLALLPDELIIQILELLEAKSLINLGATCKACFAFARSDDLWKTLCIE